MAARVVLGRRLRLHGARHRTESRWSGRGTGDRRNVGAFTAAIAILWVSSDWPVHDISEDYLYWVHMFQHMALSFFVPPLALIATPAWLLRTIIGTRTGYRTLKCFCHPVVAGVLFNGVAMLTHIPLLVNASVGDGFWNGALHYGLHVAVVVASLLMWMPVVGPIQEFRIGVPGKMIYLFLQSVVPTVPAAWLTFAEGSVYDAYETPIRLWGISVASDQQLAGAVMKLDRWDVPLGDRDLHFRHPIREGLSAPAKTSDAQPSHPHHRGRRESLRCLDTGGRGPLTGLSPRSWRRRQR